MVISGFFLSKHGDRKYTSDDLNDILNGIVSDGIIPNIGDEFFSFVDGLTVTIGTGKALLNHIWIKNTEPISLTLDQTETSLLRYDCIAIEVNYEDSARESKIVVIKGTESVSPVKPILQSSDDVKYLPVIWCLVNGSSITFEDARIYTKILLTVDKEELQEYLKIEDKASTEEAKLGTNDIKYMTPAKVASYVSTQMTVPNIGYVQLDNGTSKYKLTSPAIEYYVVTNTYPTGRVTSNLTYYIVASSGKITIYNFETYAKVSEASVPTEDITSFASWEIIYSDDTYVIICGSNPDNVNMRYYGFSLTSTGIVSYKHIVNIAVKVNLTTPPTCDSNGLVNTTRPNPIYIYLYQTSPSSRLCCITKSSGAATELSSQVSSATKSLIGDGEDGYIMVNANSSTVATVYRYDRDMAVSTSKSYTISGLTNTDNLKLYAFPSSTYFFLCQPPAVNTSATVNIWRIRYSDFTVTNKTLVLPWNASKGDTKVRMITSDYRIHAGGVSALFSSTTNRIYRPWLSSTYANRLEYWLAADEDTFSHYAGTFLKNDIIVQANSFARAKKVRIGVMIDA